MEVGTNTLGESETTILRDGNCTWRSVGFECLIPGVHSSTHITHIRFAFEYIDRLHSRGNQHWHSWRGTVGMWRLVLYCGIMTALMI
jgi:hypothetical protein